jgi:hypothetical protein
MLRKYATAMDPRLRRVSIIGSVAYLSQYRWADRWQVTFGNASILACSERGVYSFPSEAVAELVTQPYTRHLQLLLKLFSEHAAQHSCLLHELAISLRDGGLGVVSPAVRDQPNAVQR